MTMIKTIIKAAAIVGPAIAMITPSMIHAKKKTKIKTIKMMTNPKIPSIAIF